MNWKVYSISRTGKEQLMTVISDATAWGHMDGWGWGMAGFAMILLVLVVVALVAPSLANRSADPKPSMRRALEVLAERYAKGEIHRDEYVELKAELER